MTAQAPGDPNARYQLITKLGQGGMARVLLMLSRGHSRAQKLLVVKELLPNLVSDPELRAMFLDEGRLAVRLNHPNVVQTYEVTSDGDRPLIIMEYLEGQSLSALLNRVGRQEIPLDLHLFILSQVLLGLHHAHELCDFDGAPLGVVHRDVSPQNVFVTYDGQVKLVDFGIAKAAGSDTLTATGVFKGKINYASPEQIERGPLDRRSDVFAVGVMLWEALTRRRINVNATDGNAISRRLNGTDPKVAEVAPETPEELIRICEKAMAMEPADRFATADEFRVALNGYLETSKRVGMHELATLMRDAFAVERTNIRRLIDARIKEIGQAQSIAPTSSGSPSSQSSPAAEPIDEGASMGTGARMALESDHDGASSRGSGRARGGAGRGRLVIGGGIIAALVVSLIALSRLPATSAVVSTPTTAASAQIDAAPPAPSTEITIAAEPAMARIFLDDVEVGTNPFRGVLPKSAQARRVRASAPGFVTEERLVVFDRDLQLHLQLRAAPAGTVEEPRPSPPSPRPNVAAPRPANDVSGPALQPPPSQPPLPSQPAPKLGDPLPSASSKRSRPIDDAY